MYHIIAVSLEQTPNRKEMNINERSTVDLFNAISSVVHISCVSVETSRRVEPCLNRSIQLF